MNERQAASRQLFIYAENWPAHEGIPCKGLDQALIPIISSLAPLDPLIALAPATKRRMRHALHPVVNPRVITSRLDYLLGSMFDAKGLPCIERAIRSRLGTGDGGVMLSVLGGDPRAYSRAGEMAKCLGLPHIVYTVDDTFAWTDERLSNQPELLKFKAPATDCLRSAKTIFAITPALAAGLAKKLERDCDALPLPYVEHSAATSTTKRQLMFVGNMSHLYSDSFVQIVDAVRERRHRGDDIRIRVTFPVAQLEGVMSEIPDFIDFGMIANRKEFGQEIANSIAALCPIAFHPAQVMVQTSFPSKMLDYLCHSRAIIVHAPGKSVAAEYMNERGLPFVTSTRGELDDALATVSAGSENHREAYQRALHSAHGAEAFLKQFLAKSDWL